MFTILSLESSEEHEGDYLLPSPSSQHYHELNIEPTLQCWLDNMTLIHSLCLICLHYRV